jgi:DNA mismatch endonuclease (patch repair protein)
MPFEGVPEPTRRRMSRIRKTGSKPEVLVRRLAHKLGYRFRINRRDLPGTPDIVFPGRRKVIMVHGCFWHQHEGCRLANQPRTRTEYWLPKLARNVERDLRVETLLRELGWGVLIIWECEINDLEALTQRLRDFLERPLD